MSMIPPEMALFEIGQASSMPKDSRDTGLPHLILTPALAYIISPLLILGCFVGDVLMPRGATIAIGYCLVPVVAAATFRAANLLILTIACTVLNWIAVIFEPPGAALWITVSDRLIVSAVLWLTFSLVMRRLRVIQALQDRTEELTAATLELERSNDELGCFASTAAHDLRGPLNTIQLLLRLLLRADLLKSDLKSVRAIDMAKVEIARMSRLIENLLKYGRVGSGDVRLEHCDCEAVLAGIRQSMNGLITDAGAQVTNDPLPAIQADPTLIASLFQNLIENSIKYRSNLAPHIHFSAIEHSRYWRFSVRDNGIGIAAVNAEQIFKPYRQVNAGKSGSRGVGLGLATCKGIVARHGGSIEVQSKSGEGATFVFTIPNCPSLKITRMLSKSRPSNNAN